MRGDAWETQRALMCLGEDQIQQLPAIYVRASQACQPMDAEKLRQRLTALGMTLAPNRSPAEATMWLHETARLLGDLPEDLLCQAIDECQKHMKFLPTIAEIREIAEPKMDERRKVRGRIEAMKRYIESGLPIPKRLPPPKRNVMDRRGEEMSEDECNKLNAILADLGAVTRYRPDGSRYEVSERKPKAQEFDRPQMPTRADYIAWGVDPAVLDQIETEKRVAS